MSHKRESWAEAIQQTSEGITLSNTPYYPTPAGGRIIYFLEDGSKHQMVIADDESAAILLKKHNMISFYVAFKNGGVKMFVSMDLNCDRSNNIWASPTVIHWHDFEFTREQLIRFAAVNELETTAKKYGVQHEQGVVVPLYTKHKEAA